MANKQLTDLTEVSSVVDADIMHVQLDSSGANRKISFTNLSSTFFNYQKATNSEAIAGTSDVKLMTPAKTDLYIDERVADDTEAQDDTNDVNLMTPAKVKKYLESNQPSTLTEAQVVSGGGDLEAFKYYIITDSLTYTLPDVSSFTGNEYLRVNSIQGQEPTIQREGTNSEVIRINDTFTDSSILLDLNAEIIPIYNNTNNRWEV